MEGFFETRPNGLFSSLPWWRPPRRAPPPAEAGAGRLRTPARSGGRGRPLRGQDCGCGRLPGRRPSSARVDRYDPVRPAMDTLPGPARSPSTIRWPRPTGRLYVVGGYAEHPAPRGLRARAGRRLAASAVPSEGARGRGRRSSPAGSSTSSGGRPLPGRLARAPSSTTREPGAGRAFPARRRESTSVSPALGGRIYAVGGRTCRLRHEPRRRRGVPARERRWRRLPSIPGPRGGTGLAAADGRLVSVGGEEPGGDDARRSTRTTCPVAAGRGCPICRRHVTGWPSWAAERRLRDRRRRCEPGLGRRRTSGLRSRQSAAWHRSQPLARGSSPTRSSVALALRPSSSFSSRTRK